MGILFDQSQQEAIEKCLDPKVRVAWVSGGAGVGKTSIMKAVYDGFVARGKTILPCAPTGKAAKRIREVCDIPAKTIHAALEYPRPGEVDQKTGKPLVSTDPKRDHRNPLAENIILADEYSMVNVEVHRNLFDAVRSGGLIRVFGDSHQLQPIESFKKKNGDKAKPKSSFLSIMDRFPGTMLTTIHRQDEGSSIIENGHRILKGMMPKRADNYRFHMTDKPNEWIMDYFIDHQPDMPDFKSINNQIITPTNVGWTGTRALNATIQELSHSPEDEYTELDRHPWDKDEKRRGAQYLRLYVGDKVIFTANNYTLGVFNGETGIVRSWAEFGEIEIDFGDRVLVIPPAVEVVGYDERVSVVNPQKDIDLAYAITTHKSQGSEYESVMYIINASRQFMLNRNNFYTAQSRARQTVDLVCDQKSLWASVSKRGDI